MCLDDAEEDTASIHSMRSVLTSRTGNTAPCLVPGTVDIITSGKSPLFLRYSVHGVRYGPPTARLHHPLHYQCKSMLSINMHTLTVKQSISSRTKTFIGQYVAIDIEYSTEHANVAMQKLRSNGSLAVFSLLKHENKLSIMHCNVQRNEMAGDTSIIKSKEELYFQVLHYLSSFLSALFLLFISCYLLLSYHYLALNHRNSC